MAEPNHVLINFSSDSYDLPEEETSRNEATEDRITTDKVIVGCNDLTAKNDLIDHQNMESSENCGEATKPILDTSNGEDTNIQDINGHRQIDEPTDINQAHLNNSSVAGSDGNVNEQANEDSMGTKNREGIETADDSPNNNENLEANQSITENSQHEKENTGLEQSSEKEEEKKLISPITEEDENEENSDLLMDRIKVNIDESEDIKVDQAHDNEQFGISEDNVGLENVKKEINESVISDENNNEVASDWDQGENQGNEVLDEGSIQLNSDSRAYIDNENNQDLKQHQRETVYINLMKDTLGTPDLMDGDSQLSYTDMDAKMGDSARSGTRPQTTSTMREVPGGLRAKANTPASFYMPSNELDSSRDDKGLESGRAPSRVSREEVFQRAMTLMSNRCTSAREEEDALFSGREPPFGVNIPEYFYVHQRKPVPMAPLKVWRGYKGNVYFEPMSIKSMSNSNSGLYSLPGTSLGRHKSASLAPTRATTAGTKKSYRLVNSSPQVFIMDKHNVVRSDNYDIEQDLRFIEGIESTGSLAVRPPSHHLSLNKIHKNPPKSSQKEKRLLHKRERICRGSNYHTIQNKNATIDDNNKYSNSINKGNQGSHEYYSSRKSYVSGSSRKSSLASSKISTRRHQSSNAGPKAKSTQDLMISGDKFALPTVMSPILRSTTNDPYVLHRQQPPFAESPDLYKDYSDMSSMNRVHVSMEQIDLNDDKYSKTGSHSQQDNYSEAVTPYVDISFKKATVDTY